MTPCLRPLTDLEKRFYSEKIASINAMLDATDTGMDDQPPTAVIKAATDTAELFQAIGFVPTKLGPMARIDPDIIDQEHPADFMNAVNADWAQAKRAMTMQ